MTPELSVVLIVPGDGAGLDEALSALLDQRQSPAIEVIVPHVDPAGLEPGRDDPRVRFLPAAGSFDEQRARGIDAARAPLVAMTEDHAVVASDWARRILESRRHDAAAVGGVVENGIDRALNWAVYFCDFARFMAPRPAGPAQHASDVNVVYRREALEAIRETWEGRFHETVVNGELLGSGRTLWSEPALIVRQVRRNLRLAPALRERYLWGRLYAGVVARRMPTWRRGVYTALSPLLPPLLLVRNARVVFSKRRNRGAFLRAVPLMLLLLTWWAAGELAGYLTGRPQARKGSRS